MRTLILLGADISNGTSSAFLFVPDGASKLSRSIESILGKRVKIKGGMLAVFKRAFHKEVLFMQFLMRWKFRVSEPRQKSDEIPQLSLNYSQCSALSHLFYGNSSIFF